MRLGQCPVCTRMDPGLQFRGYAYYVSLKHPEPAGVNGSTTWGPLGAPFAWSGLMQGDECMIVSSGNTFITCEFQCTVLLKLKKH